MENLTINNGVYQPKLNFSFYRQTRDDKELSNGNQDGFSALVEGLLSENVDVIVSTYYHALAWYKRNQPSETDVEEALEASVFASDEATDQAFADILNALKADGFLARKLREYVKNSDKNADMVQAQIDQTKDEERASQLSIGLKEITAETNKLKSLLASDESSPKPGESDLAHQN
ncbi:tail assembly chaperone [Limosilactobacillus sp.]|jgi:hypothetical protein|uniref:tail assembly chaperone n=1 Tax=Limosilactobacillus sp. TaxID=2773925 RepID=UPI0025C62EE8|nr:tail assembly chaperone [Limosilactobacillus sp.]MCH3922385.1 tail assembly chaperone [Limosilactobacillus sp.]MCH3929157.1 tail assembly chaperone [Limosilactobacillus sp.]